MVAWQGLRARRRPGAASAAPGFLPVRQATRWHAPVGLPLVGAARGGGHGGARTGCHSHHGDPGGRALACPCRCAQRVRSHGGKQFPNRRHRDGDRFRTWNVPLAVLAPRREPVDGSFLADGRGGGGPDVQPHGVGGKRLLRRRGLGEFHLRIRHRERNLPEPPGASRLRDGTTNPARGIAGTSQTLWVATEPNSGVANFLAFKRQPAANIGDRDSTKDITGAIDNSDFTGLLHNDDPTGLWSDGTYLYAVEQYQGVARKRGRVFAYSLADGNRVKSKEFLLDWRHYEPKGIWANTDTFWIVNGDRHPKTLSGQAAASSSMCER